METIESPVTVACVGSSALLGSVAFGLLWIDSEFMHEGVLWRKTHNTFGKRMSEIRADTSGGYWPFAVDQQVGATVNVRTKRVVLFLPNAVVTHAETGSRTHGESRPR